MPNTPPQKSSSARRSLSPKGFSLIELLVAIATVSILAGILITVTGKAQASAHAVTCTSNLRQIYAAIIAYSNDNDGRLPGPNAMGQGPFYTKTDAAASPHLAAQIKPYLGTAEIRATERGAYRWREDVFCCPAWVQNDGLKQPRASNDAVVSYILNLIPWPLSHFPIGGNNNLAPFGNSNSALDHPRRLPRQLHELLQYPLEKTWMLADADNQFLADVMSYPGSVSYVATPSHVKMRNVLFYDGRVESVPVGELQRYPQAGNAN